MACNHLPVKCEDLLEAFADTNPSVDNLSRKDELLANFPVGQGYETLIYYLQAVKNTNFMRFDYGPMDNKKVYGQSSAPAVPLADMTVPTALVSGSYDPLGDPTDVAWLADQLKNITVFNQEYPLGHLSFTLAKDMSWFSDDVMGVINKYATNDFSTEAFIQ